MTERTHEPDATRLPACVTGWKAFTDGDLIHDGSQLLVAVPICGNDSTDWYYEFHVVQVELDSEHFAVTDSNGDDWGWDLSDCEFYVEMSK